MTSLCSPFNRLNGESRLSPPELIYFVAQSVDGYITDLSGSVDWLQDFEQESEDYGYHTFYKSIDSIVMGGNTYRFIRQFSNWPYPNLPCWVFSKRPFKPDDEQIIRTQQSPAEVLNKVRQKGYFRTWLVGGGRLAHSFLTDRLITRYILTIIPVILGGGTPVIVDPQVKSRLLLEEKRVFSCGVVQLTYTPYSPEETSGLYQIT